MTLGEVIRGYRERHGLSIRGFAEKCGLSHSYIANIERGKDPRTNKEYLPSIGTLKVLAETMGMSVEELTTKAGFTESRSDIEHEVVALEDLLKRTDIHLYLGGRPLTPEEREDVADFLRLVLKIRDRKEGTDS